MLFGTGPAKGAILPLPRIRWSYFLGFWFGLTLLAFPMDDAITNWIHAHPHLRFIHEVFTFPDFFGGFSIHLLTLGIVIALRRDLKEALFYIALMGWQALLSEALKHSIGRARPDDALGASAFFHYRHPGVHANSFPSGDATSAMALATLLGLYFPAGRWFFWFLGAWTAFGRVAAEKHFLSDAIFGAGLGVFAIWSGLAILRRFFAPRTTLEPGLV